MYSCSSACGHSFMEVCVLVHVCTCMFVHTWKPALNWSLHFCLIYLFAYLLYSRIVSSFFRKRFILRVWVFCLYEWIYVCAPQVCSALGGQKRALDPLELELRDELPTVCWGSKLWSSLASKDFLSNELSPQPRALLSLFVYTMVTHSLPVCILRGIFSGYGDIFSTERPTSEPSVIPT